MAQVSYTVAMFMLRSTIVGVPILSLRTGSAIGATVTEIINPNNLKIVGFYCENRFNSEATVLLAQDIREIAKNGIIVNDHEVLSEPKDLIRLKKIIAIEFDAIGKTVVTESKTKVGKVEDYAVEKDSLFIKKLYVSRSMLKSFGSGQLAVDRNEVVEVTDKKIIIKDILQPTKIRSTINAMASGS